MYKGSRLPEAQDIHAGNLEQILSQLPLTTKDELASAGREAFAVSTEQVAEWVCTSGTTGKPLDIPLTRRDLERLAVNEQIALSIAGVGPGAVVLLAVGMERMFVAGLAYWLGAQRLQASCVRLGPRIDSQQLQSVLARVSGDRPTFLISVPTYLLGCRSERSLAGIIAIGEPIRSGAESWGLNSLGLQLHEKFRCPILSTYASSETCTTFAEGPQCEGGHLNPELGILEVLDEQGRAIPVGSSGEVVLTPLGIEGLPLIRFCTGDIATVRTEPCPCGRTTPRVGPILGRKQHLLKVRGVSIYPTAIIEALRSLPGGPECLIVAEEETTLSDRLTIHLAASADMRPQVDAALRALLRITPEIRFTDPDTLHALQQSAGRKAARFIDRRPIRNYA